MIRGLLIGFIAASIALSSTINAQDMPKPATPEKEHQWLQQFVGEWTSEAEAMMEPGKPPIKGTGTESVKPLGALWVIGEGNATVMGMNVLSRVTLGYDPMKKKFVGSWVDSCQTKLWNYEGTLDPTGTILTLDTEGPNMMAPGTTMKFRDIIELKGKDQKVMKSSMEVEPGKWVTFMTIHYTRKK